MHLKCLFDVADEHECEKCYQTHFWQKHFHGEGHLIRKLPVPFRFHKVQKETKHTVELVVIFKEDLDSVQVLLPWRRHMSCNDSLKIEFERMLNFNVQSQHAQQILH